MALLEMRGHHLLMVVPNRRSGRRRREGKGWAWAGFQAGPGNRSVSRIRLTQINLHRCHAAALATAGRTVGPVDATHSPPPSIPHSDIFLIQEPYCYHNRITSLPRGQVFAVHKDQIRPRACIWTSSNCSVNLIPELSDPDMVTIETSWRSHKIVFASIYMPYDSNVHPNPLLDDLVSFCATEKSSVLTVIVTTPLWAVRIQTKEAPSCWSSSSAGDLSL